MERPRGESNWPKRLAEAADFVVRVLIVASNTELIQKSSLPHRDKALQVPQLPPSQTQTILENKEQKNLPRFDESNIVQ
ncbi:MAG: hypothetical protein ABIO02_02560 [Patescibacteria group bacterium]